MGCSNSHDGDSGNADTSSDSGDTQSDSWATSLGTEPDSSDTSTGTQADGDTQTGTNSGKVQTGTDNSIPNTSAGMCQYDYAPRSLRGYVNDEERASVVFEYNAEGNVTIMDENTTTVRRTEFTWDGNEITAMLAQYYNDEGRPSYHIESTFQYGEDHLPTQWDLHYYDDEEARTKFRSRYLFSYDAGRLSEMTMRGCEAEGDCTLKSDKYNYVRDTAGRLTAIVGNTVTKSFTYDENNRIADAVTSGADTESVISLVEYAYGDNGRLETKTNIKFWDNSATTGGTRNYVYEGDVLSMTNYLSYIDDMETYSKTYIEYTDAADGCALFRLWPRHWQELHRPELSIEHNATYFGDGRPTGLFW